MIHEIEPKVFSNEYAFLPARDEDYVAIFKGNEIYLKDNADDIIPKASEIKDKSKLLYLFKIDDNRVYLWYDDEEPGIIGGEYKNVRNTREIYEQFYVFLIFTAWHLYVWYRDNKYCGRCSRKMTVGTKERNMICECGHMVFPKIMPAVIVGVRNGEKLLVTRYAHRKVKRYALIAGFCEIGESGEETVAREVMEEVGLSVKNITYFASQPWGIDQDFLLGYYCDVDGSDEITMDEEELSTAKWLDRKDLEPAKNTVSLTATMIESFRLGADRK